MAVLLEGEGRSSGITGMHIDHMIPFVAIRNDDLWNMVPSRGDVNIRKSNRIPAGELLKQPLVMDDT
jgi:CRISPR/Cas system Type II protein with McrA/HNH and RuvC-like nuclease domain